MIRKLYFTSTLFVVLCFAIPLYAQNKVVIHGDVFDSFTQQSIPGVNVSVVGSPFGATTNNRGHFEIQGIPQGEWTLRLSFVGYQPLEKKVNLQEEEYQLTVYLQEENKELGAIEIRGSQMQQTEQALKLMVPLKDVPVTTSTVGADLLKEKEYLSLNDAMQYTTGINPIITYGGFQTFTMRGFASPVIMVDGARDERMNFSNSAPVTSLAAVDHIEFLKGPASVLYGHSALGGILNIVRKQPSQNFNLQAQASVGSWDSKNISIGAGNKINDKLSYRFDVALANNDGWRDNNTETLNGYLALDYQLSDNDQFSLRVGGNDDLYGTETGLPSVTHDIYNSSDELVYRQGDLPSNFDREQRYNDPADFLKHHNWNVDLKYEHQFSKDSRLSYHLAIANDVIDYFSTEELSYLTSSEPLYANYYLSGTERTYISLDSLQRSYPLRFSHHTDTYQQYLDFYTRFKTGQVEHNLLAGYYLMLVDRTSYTGYDLGNDVWGDGLYSNISVVNPVLNRGNLQTKFSAARIYDEMVNGFYLQDQLSISRKLKALIGLRLDAYCMYNRTADVEHQIDLINKSERSKQDELAFTYKAGLVYEPTNDLSLYASVSNFFKPNRTVYNGDYIYLNANGHEFTPGEGSEFFSPETGFQVEGGIKYNLNRKLQVNASTFYIAQNNIVENLGNSSDNRRVYGQVGKVDSKGFDVETIFLPFDGFKLIAGYGKTIAKYREFAANDYSTSSRRGNEVSYAPEDKVYSWAYYSVPSGFFSGLSVGAGANYTGNVFTESSNNYSLPGYTLIDASLAYAIGNAYLKLNVYNLADKEYFSNTVYSTQYIPGPSRNFKLTLGITI